MGRICDTVLQPAIIRQQHQPFAVPVETAGRIYPGQINVVRQGWPLTAFITVIGELAKHTPGLIECNKQYEA
jgi:hypothetical protein